MSGAHAVLAEADDTGGDRVSITRCLVNGVNVGRFARALKISVD